MDQVVRRRRSPRSAQQPIWFPMLQISAPDGAPNEAAESDRVPYGRSTDQGPVVGPGGRSAPLNHRTGRDVRPAGRAQILVDWAADLGVRAAQTTSSALGSALYLAVDPERTPHNDVPERHQLPPRGALRTACLCACNDVVAARRIVSVEAGGDSLVRCGPGFRFSCAARPTSASPRTHSWSVRSRPWVSVSRVASYRSTAGRGRRWERCVRGSPWRLRGARVRRVIAKGDAAAAEPS